MDNYGEECRETFMRLTAARTRARSPRSKAILLEQINDEIDLYLTWLDMNQPPQT